MLLKAEFLSITLVLVYVGAVMVLFLFVVMMMDINVENLRAGFWQHFPFAALVGVVIALEMAAVLMGGFRVVGEPQSVAVGGAAVLQGTNNTQALGTLLFTQYVFPLEVAAAILLVAVIAAIALTLRTRKDSKYVDPAIQVRVKSRDRMTVIKMTATQAAPDPVPVVVQPENKV
jgi:NADH-quinone oxidoreductase subunit J